MSEIKAVTRNKKVYLPLTIRVPLEKDKKQESEDLLNLVADSTLALCKNQEITNPYIVQYDLGTKASRSLTPWLIGFVYLFYRRQRVKFSSSFLKSFLYGFGLFTVLSFGFNLLFVFPTEDSFKVYIKKAILHKEDDKSISDFMSYIKKLDYTF